MNKHSFKTAILSIGILVLSSTLMFSQGSGVDVKKYFDRKYQAELSLVDSNYKKANELYKQAFSVKSPFPRDLYNALVTSCIVFDTSFAKDCYNQLISLGYNFDKIKRYKGVAYINEHRQEFLQQISKDKDFYLLKYNLSGKKMVVAVLDSLFAIDQIYRIYYKTEDSFRKYDKTNLSFLQAYINQNGFPDFTKAGGVELASTSIHESETLFFLHWHHRGISTFLDTVYYQAVMDGKYDPAMYAVVMDMNKDIERFYQLLFDPWMDNDIYKIKIKGFKKDLEVESVNEARSKIYLEPIQQYLRKLKFMYQSGDHRFFLVNGQCFALNQFVSSEDVFDLN